MLQTLMPIIVLLSWLALPVTLLCVVDDWFLRPRRQLRAGPEGVRDAPLMGVLYSALVILVGAAVLRLLLAERLDFSAVLLAITVVTGVIWGLDLLFFGPQRAAAARAAGRDPALIREPGTVDYARSFFPVALVVLVLRSFIFEPFRIPSDSMMPTLLDGDFIIVNKYAYGLRLPVINQKIIAVGEPQRGDVVVFRWPVDPSVNFIKRLVGLPGDHVEVRDNHITVNGRPVPAEVNAGRFNRGGVRGFVCGDEDAPGERRVPLFVGDVPAGQYLMMGDNRDNSDDGRSWGCVPEQNLVGKERRIWFTWAQHRDGCP